MLAVVSHGGKATLSGESAQNRANESTLVVSARQRQTLANQSVVSPIPVVQTGRDGWGPRPLSRSPLNPECIPVTDHHGENDISVCDFNGPLLLGVQEPISPSTTPAGFFSPGSAFPFLSASSLTVFSPLSPVSSPPPSHSFSFHAASSNPLVESSSLSASESVGFFTMGSSFPCLPSCPAVNTSPKQFSSLGTWISAKGGRHKFVVWLSSECDRLIKENWRDMDPVSVWSLLNAAGWESQVEYLLMRCRNVDLVEHELTSLLLDAQRLQLPVFPHHQEKRTQGVLVRPPGGTRCQRRNFARKTARLLRRRAKAKHKRRMACFRASGRASSRKKGEVVIGNWNTRGLGAPKGKDPEGKYRALFSLMLERGWNAALLTDTRFEFDGFSQVTVMNRVWLVVHYGKVAVALDPWLAARWRAAGSPIKRVKGWPDGERCFGIRIPREGWRPGLVLAPVYAPLAHKTPVALREKCRELVGSILESASSSCRVILGGDLNGEVGATLDNKWRHVMGPFGDSRRTKGGEELLVFCEQEGLIVADTYTRQKHKGTWFHPKQGTEHKLDHFLVASSSKRWVKSVHTLRFSSRQVARYERLCGRPLQFSRSPWLPYTDHDPVEMIFCMGRNWKLEAVATSESNPKPDVSRFLGSSVEAANLRRAYAEAVTSELNSYQGQFLCWDVIADLLKKVALKTVGTVPQRDHRPWFRGKEKELAALESAAHKAELTWRRASSRNEDSAERALSNRRLASAKLRAAKRKWEACWWDDLACQAQEADSSGDSAAFWQICRQLGFRESLRRQTGCRATVADVAGEREAWKLFLSNIQAGEGAVAYDVWKFVPLASEIDKGLQGPPSWAEFESALKSMKLGKRGGLDDITVELIRFGGPELHCAVFEIISDMWLTAAEAEPGNEAGGWSTKVTTGICIPMFKNKGDRNDKSNYRNLVMLSVAAKLVARIAASRLNRWASSFLSEEQNGFRAGRGIDDVHQLTRRVLEEISVAASETVNSAPRVGLTCFDIVRAYTRVCRMALWDVLARMGVPEDFLAVLKALHDHTRFMVFVHNGYSSAWFTDRGLREGCPSSPILFSIFHHCVMMTFRARRQEKAQSLNSVPGVPWSFKVDGKLSRAGHAKRSSRGIERAVVGDTEYADDTALFGVMDELQEAEKLFVQTLNDWDQQEHPGKREKLVVVAGGRTSFEVLHRFEARALKHLGATHTANADQWAETRRRVQAGFFAVKRIAKLWSLGSHRGRGSHRGLTTTRKLKVMRAVLEGTLLACGKTRVWRCLGLDIFNMSENCYDDAALRKMVGWDHFSILIHRQVLKWVGHVARMHVTRAPKVALFGWPKGLEAHRSCRLTFPQWVKWLLHKYGFSEMDWFRLAQKPTGRWLQLVHQNLPRSKPSRKRQAEIDAWRIGHPILPAISGSSVQAPKSETSPSNVSSLQCPACPYTATTPRGLQVHYEGQHAVSDNTLITVGHSRCSFCNQLFVFARDVPRHECPAKVNSLAELEASSANSRRLNLPVFESDVVERWLLFVDGSGPHENAPHAGWGIAIWEQNSDSATPECELYGPVPLQQWDKRYLGAERATNNVGELTAMTEALLWLLEEAPGTADAPATILYDSEYAHRALTSCHAPEANEKLVLAGRDILSKVKVRRHISFVHVKAHTGVTGNEFADHLAKLGAKGQLTSMSSRWLLPCDVPPPPPAILADNCWRCGKVYSGPSHARSLAGHEAHCKVPGAPPAFIPCRHNCGKQFAWQFATGKRKQPHHAREFRNTHERICRGTDELTRTCPFCSYTFVIHTTDATILLHRLECPDRPEQVSNERPSWHCPLCKAHFTAGSKEEHMQTCKGSAQKNRTCSKCNATFQTKGARETHESFCRGSEKANLTCEFCKREFSTFGSRMSHEKACPRRPER